MRAELGTFVTLEGGPQGNRIIANVVGGTFDGPRLRGQIESPGGDWLIRLLTVLANWGYASRCAPMMAQPS